VNILVIGAGAREHALVRALAAGSPVGDRVILHAAPGNPGIAALAELHAIDPFDGAAVAALAARLGADLVVVGNRGLNSLAGRLLGSVPASISHRARCDVLVVHTTGREVRP